jgi:hypothetical protein
MKEEARPLELSDSIANRLNRLEDKVVQMEHMITYLMASHPKLIYEEYYKDEVKRKEELE